MNPLLGWAQLALEGVKFVAGLVRSARSKGTPTITRMPSYKTENDAFAEQVRAEAAKNAGKP